MTEENYNYRTSPFLLRNQFSGKTQLKIPVIPKFNPQEGDFEDLKLIGFDKTSLENTNHLNKPSKPEDERFLGKPGEIKTTYIKGKRVDTKIGEDGRAVFERHYTNHGFPKYHTIPHDHPVIWDLVRGFPHLGPSINYLQEIPEFKNYRGMKSLTSIVQPNSLEDNRFKSISDFKDCMIRGGEVEFEYMNKSYSIAHTENRIVIAQPYKPETEKMCADADEVLEYRMDGVRLRDVITKVNVLARTI